MIKLVTDNGSITQEHTQARAMSEAPKLPFTLALQDSILAPHLRPSKLTSGRHFHELSQCSPSVPPASSYPQHPDYPYGSRYGWPLAIYGRIC